MTASLAAGCVGKERCLGSPPWIVPTFQVSGGSRMAQGGGAAQGIAVVDARIARGRVLTTPPISRLICGTEIPLRAGQASLVRTLHASPAGFWLGRSATILSFRAMVMQRSPGGRHHLSALKYLVSDHSFPQRTRQAADRVMFRFCEDFPHSGEHSKRSRIGAKATVVSCPDQQRTLASTGSVGTPLLPQGPTPQAVQWRDG